MKGWLRQRFGLLNPLYLSGFSRSERKVPVLCYHRILPDMRSPTSSCMHLSPELFEAHVARLAGLGFRFLGLEEFKLMISGQVGYDPRAVLMTIDDGYRDLLLVYERLAKKYAFRATLFVVGSAIETAGPFLLHPLDEPAREHLGRHPELWDALGWRELRHLREMGADLGMHGHVHAPVSEIEPNEFERQIRSDREAMERGLGLLPQAFALPFGHDGTYSREHLERLLGCGIRLIFSTRASRVRMPASSLPLPRLVVQTGESPEIMCRDVFGASDIIGAFKHRKGVEVPLP